VGGIFRTNGREEKRGIHSVFLGKFETKYLLADLGVGGE
jgi:hypothetical protein